MLLTNLKKKKQDQRNARVGGQKEIYKYSEKGRFSAMSHLQPKLKYFSDKSQYVKKKERVQLFKYNFSKNLSAEW